MFEPEFNVAWAVQDLIEEIILERNGQLADVRLYRELLISALEDFNDQGQAL